MRSSKPLKVEFAGVGHYVPEKRLTNQDLERMVDTSDEWITTRSGIKERRIASEDQASSDLAFEAAKVAMEQAQLSGEELDMVICATITPDYLFPATACVVQDKLGAVNAMAYDTLAACSGFVFSCAQAASAISAGICSNALVIGTECLSKITDYEDRSSCVLFGDGAGAAVLRASSSPEREFLFLEMGVDGSRPEILFLPGGGSRMPTSEKTLADRQHYMKMMGREVFKYAVEKLVELIKRIPQECDISLDRIKTVIMHQMNIRIIETSCRRSGFPFEKAYVNIDKYGNTSAASIPIAMSEACADGTLERGDLGLLLSFGGGLTWGSLLFRY